MVWQKRAGRRDNANAIMHALADVLDIDWSWVEKYIKVRGWLSDAVSSVDKAFEEVNGKRPPSQEPVSLQLAGVETLRIKGWAIDQNNGKAAGNVLVVIVSDFKAQTSGYITNNRQAA